MVRDTAGFVLRSDGRRASVVHQYDRGALGLADAFDAKGTALAAAHP